MLLMRTAYTSLLIVKTLYTCTVCGQSTNSLQTLIVCEQPEYHIMRTILVLALYIYSLHSCIMCEQATCFLYCA